MVDSPPLTLRRNSEAECSEAPVQLTVDTDPNMVRIEVRDEDPSLPGTGTVASFKLRDQHSAG
jgi:hypothetical protein